MSVPQVTVQELGQAFQGLVRRVSEQGETIEITDAGRPVARLVPADADAPHGAATAWADLDALTDEITAHWTGPDAEAAVRDVRRTL